MVYHFCYFFKNDVASYDCLGTDSELTVMMQFVASAPTLFPGEYVEEFQKCFDRAPAIPYDVIESILREELQRPLDSVYEYIDPVPIASASIAQVCLGTFFNYIMHSDVQALR